MLRIPRFARRHRRAILLGVMMILALPALAVADTVNGSWQQLSPGGTAPPWRKYFAATYDATHERLVVDGGWAGGIPYYNDTWALTLSGPPAWTQLTSNDFLRDAHSGIYDAPRDRMLIFGWSDGYPFGYFNQVHELPLAGTPAWTALSPAGTLPAGRIRHSIVRDPVRDRMLVFGGQIHGVLTNSNELWELSLSGTPTWTLLTPAGTPPSGRVSHSAIYDPVRDRMLVFGGTTSSGMTTEVWELILSGTPTWNQVATSGTPPDGRTRHAAIYDPLRDRMVVFGGYATGNVQMNDAWALSLSGNPTWSQLTPDGIPPAVREGHRAIYDAPRDRMVVYGGQYPPEDLWVLNWSPVVGIPPTPHAGAALSLQMRPNPAVTDVAVEFTLPREGAARVAVYDLRGARVRSLADGQLPEGLTRLRWDRTTDEGQRAVSGVYFLSVRSESGNITRRLLLID